jgi:hypothetical protein
MFREMLMPLVLVVASPAAVNVRDVLDAIRKVETGGHPAPAQAVGDGGRSLGPYQIGRKYWRDSGVPGRYEWVRDTAYAERVILGYWRRHCPDALRPLDAETLARTHNGGPGGPSKRATLPYWHRVRGQLRR